MKLMDYNTLKWVVSGLPVVQLLPVQPAAQEVHDPSLGRQVSGLQFGEHFREQFVPKYPPLQARGRILYTSDIS